jgi:hypothetical protein
MDFHCVYKNRNLSYNSILDHFNVITTIEISYNNNSNFINMYSKKLFSSVKIKEKSEKKNPHHYVLQILEKNY